MGAARRLLAPRKLPTKSVQVEINLRGRGNRGSVAYATVMAAVEHRPRLIIVEVHHLWFGNGITSEM